MRIPTFFPSKAQHRELGRRVVDFSHFDHEMFIGTAPGIPDTNEALRADELFELFELSVCLAWSAGIIRSMLHFLISEGTMKRGEVRSRGEQCFEVFCDEVGGWLGLVLRQMVWVKGFDRTFLCTGTCY